MGYAPTRTRPTPLIEVAAVGAGAARNARPDHRSRAHGRRDAPGRRAVFDGAVFSSVERLPAAAPGMPRRQASVHGRIAPAADALGARSKVRTPPRRQQREQFDQVIGLFQVVKHMCAETAAALDPIESLAGTPPTPGISVYEARHLAPWSRPTPPRLRPTGSPPVPRCSAASGRPGRATGHTSSGSGTTGRCWDRRGGRAGGCPATPGRAVPATASAAQRSSRGAVGRVR